MADFRSLKFNLVVTVCTESYTYFHPVSLTPCAHDALDRAVQQQSCTSSAHTAGQANDNPPDDNS